MERILLPGGLARYLAEFCGQFYNQVFLGATVLCLLYLFVQQLVWMTAKVHCKYQRVGYLLSFIPVIVLWFAMGDENIKLTFVVALILALVAMSAYPEGKSKMCRLLYLAVAMPLLFWFAGPTMLLLVAYVVVSECIKPKEDSGRVHWQPLLYTAFIFALGMAVVPCPTYRLFYGINYYIQINQFPTMLYVVMAVCLLMVIIARYIPVFQGERTEGAVVGGLGGAVLASALLIVPLGFDQNKYDVLEYDHLVRGMKWEKIIKKAESTEAKSPLSAASYNLALGKLGLMNRAFEFRQNGWGGAFPPFNKNYIASLMTSEIYWHLGLVNTAQRYVFEAMETIPDNNKSSRIVRRLAETNMVNGQYDVARKYLMLLQKTIFYRKWATEMLSLLGNEEAINNHSFYGFIRKSRLNEDFIFSDQEIDKIMGQLVLQNPDNNLAISYLLLLPQLEGNQQKYMMFLDFVQKRKMQAAAPNDSTFSSTTERESIVNDSINDSSGITVKGALRAK